MANSVLPDGRLFFDGTGDSAIGDYNITGITFTGGANTNAVVINDADDKLIWKATANTGQLDFNVTLPQTVRTKQVKVATLGGGEVIVWT